jgi:STE24 endopeptidase
LLLLVFLTAGVAWAQEAPATAIPPQHQATTAQAAHFDVEVATNAYMAELSPAQRARSDAYFEGGYWLIVWDLLVALGVAVEFHPKLSHVPG